MVSGETPIAFGSSFGRKPERHTRFQSNKYADIGVKRTIFLISRNFRPHFNSIVLPTLLAGLVWDSSQLYTNGR